MRVALESGMIDGYVSERPEGVSATAPMKTLLWLNLRWSETSDDDTAIAVGLPQNSDLTEKLMKYWQEYLKKNVLKLWTKLFVTNRRQNNNCKTDCVSNTAGFILVLRWEMTYEWLVK